LVASQKDEPPVNTPTNNEFWLYIGEPEEPPSVTPWPLSVWDHCTCQCVVLSKPKPNPLEDDKLLVKVEIFIISPLGWWILTPLEAGVFERFQPEKYGSKSGSLFSSTKKKSGSPTLPSPPLLASLEQPVIEYVLLGTELLQFGER